VSRENSGGILVVRGIRPKGFNEIFRKGSQSKALQKKESCRLVNDDPTRGGERFRG